MQHNSTPTTASVIRRVSVLLLAASAALFGAAAPVSAADTTAPTAPDASAEGAGPLSVYWATAVDDDDVTAYRVFRNGRQIATVPADANSYHDHALTGNTWYTYGVQAVDAAGNTSPTTTLQPLKSAPLLRFPADRDDRVEGVLEASRPVLVDFATDRLPKCRSRYAGGDAWSINVEYRVDGGPVQSQPATRLNDDRRQVTALAPLSLPLGARNLELWFVSGDITGCTEYDSRFGANYRYTIEQPTVVSFNADWSESLTGQVRKDQTLTVRYDVARLPQCRETLRGMPGWHIDVFYRLDDGPTLAKRLTDHDGEALPATIDLQPSTSRVEIWFRVYGQVSRCTAYDSDHGRNYIYQTV
ncbi:hypothetical protein BC793_11384 [Actinoplanes xinjiangensis]|uniref:Fibronectin type-III domain-containing protein n=1 Tax=Actinoplanes xinjiangensis TaxID=512350 RepID=A0A316FSY1_9ACTN|nr:hypothetical protein BC793_11384 [Actinoplanes xinjiangensis]GIF41719.1 hypothetical protein Axi01nite_60300 [Actinoplanes xinjiangensis]